MPTVKPPKINKSRLLPVSPVVTKLLNFFTHQWDFILKRKNENWITITNYPIQPRNFEQMWADPDIALGLRFGINTKFGCVDIDTKSQNNPLINRDRYNKVIKALKQYLRQMRSQIFV